MGFKDLRNLPPPDSEKVQQFKDEFPARLKAHEEKFQKESEALKPKSAWYDRTYDI